MDPSYWRPQVASDFKKMIKNTAYYALILFETLSTVCQTRLVIFSLQFYSRWHWLKPHTIIFNAKMLHPCFHCQVLAAGRTDLVYAEPSIDRFASKQALELCGFLFPTGFHDLYLCIKSKQDLFCADKRKPFRKNQHQNSPELSGGRLWGRALGAKVHLQTIKSTLFL